MEPSQYIPSPPESQKISSWKAGVNASISILLLLAACAFWYSGSAHSGSKATSATVGVNDNPYKTLDALMRALQNAYAAKDANAVLALFYPVGIDDKTKASLLKYITADFPYGVSSVVSGEPATNAIYQYTQDGITYGVNLPVLKEVHVRFKDTTKGPTETSFYAGVHDGTYYLVTAAPTSAPAPQPGNATDTATIHFVRKAVMRTLNFAQGDLAGYRAAHDDFTPDGWSSYTKHMDGFLDSKGAPLFSSEFTPSGDPVVIDTQNGVMHLYIPGTLKQTQNISSTTYRGVKIDVIAGGKPLKLEKLETVLCASKTASAPCN